MDIGLARAPAHIGSGKLLWCARVIHIRQEYLSLTLPLFLPAPHAGNARADADAKFIYEISFRLKQQREVIIYVFRFIDSHMPNSTVVDIRTSNYIFFGGFTSQAFTVRSARRVGDKNK